MGRGVLDLPVDCKSTAHQNYLPTSSSCAMIRAQSAKISLQPLCQSSLELEEGGLLSKMYENAKPTLCPSPGNFLKGPDIIYCGTNVWKRFDRY